MFTNAVRFFLVCILAFAHSAMAQTYPSKPIRIIIPFSAPGGSDAAGRAIADALRDRMGVAVVVENKPGANGNIGAQAVARAPADGYTLLLVSTSLVTSPSLYVDPGYDATRDFAPVALIGSIPLLAVAPAGVQARNVTEFAEWARRNPGLINYGSAGVGNVTHLVAQAFFEGIGAKAVHVPYKGGAPVTDLVANRLQFYAGSPTSLLPLVKEGRLVPLAVTTRARLAMLPDVPTLHETVLPGFDRGLWYGVSVAAGTPEPIVKALSEAVKAALGEPTVRQKFEQQGMVVNVLGPTDFSGFVKSELDFWTRAIRASGVKPE
jgi:tripartite-type tricarboxylate transporter receptor subunit TctC